MSPLKSMPKTSCIASRKTSACRLSVGSNRFEPVPPFYNRAAGEVIGYLPKAHEIIPVRCSPAVQVCASLAGNATTSRHSSTRSLSLFKESLPSPTCKHMKQRRLSRRGSGKLFRGRMRYRLDIVYNECLYETSWSLQSLATGAVVAASGFNEVTEFSFFSSSVSLFLATSTSL
jgi:hypothetical protein